MRFSAREDVISITPLNPFDRFDDGRPKVPNDLIERMKLVTTEEAWEVLRENGYNFQFEGSLVNLHPDRVLVGQAITATMVPIRPDLEDVVKAQGEREGLHLTPARWVLNAVRENDVVVVDIFGKVKNTFIGDNLAFGVSSQKGAGLVIDGGIRDPGGVYDAPNINVFCCGFDPGVGAGEYYTLSSLNGPTRIGEATVLPGDIVMGNREGVLFIPPHLVEEVIKTSEEIRLREAFERQRIQELKYPVYQIYGAEWGDEIKADFEEWRKQRQS